MVVDDGMASRTQRRTVLAKEMRAVGCAVRAHRAHGALAVFARADSLPTRFDATLAIRVRDPRPVPAAVPRPPAPAAVPRPPPPRRRS